MNPASSIPLIEAQDYDQLSSVCATAMLDCVTRKPDAVLCLATGHSPQGAYRAFVHAALEQRLDLSRVLWVKLDEWIGLPPEDPATCEFFLRKEIMDPLHVAPEAYLAFQSDTSDPYAECKRVATELERRGPIDLVILGVGKNGHIGLNEPAEDLQSEPHVASLTPSTRDHPMLLDAARPVTEGMTLGVGDIFAANKVVLLITGSGKGEALDAFRAQTPSTLCPVTLLQLHPNLLAIADPSAA